MLGGYTGKIAFVNLSDQNVREEHNDEKLCREYIGGYGLGVRVLYEHQQPEIPPLDPANILGFTTGPLTGTKVPTGARYTVVCKSPLTGGWGDANSGGEFGAKLKACGWDAIFVQGAASSPKYLLVTPEKVEIRDASDLWGKDTVETEESLRNDFGSKISAASIGPAGERLSLISGIVNDKGRIAARSGVGSIMGSKRLKAVVVSGKGSKVHVADENRLDALRKTFVRELPELGGFAQALMDYGTCGLTGPLIAGGATPIKNWLLAGEKAFPTSNRITDPDEVIRFQTKKYGCANCPIVCGGLYSVSKGEYPVGEVHKPEYETIAAFGAMCLNDDFLSIIKINDMCNRGGLDTISAGTAISFAMECFEKGIISEKDTDGIKLTWGNSDAVISMVDKMIRREGFGEILADGVKAAAEKLGNGAQEYAVHVGGQEPGMHSALFMPSRGTGYVCDPTPGRHTAAPMTRLDGGTAVYAPYPELKFEGFERYDYKNKGDASAKVSCYWQIGACSGVCLFPVIFFGNYPLIDFLQAVTGWEMDVDEALETGARIQTLRQCFNIREGIEPSKINLPPRMLGIPPHETGPLAKVTIDIKDLRQEYNRGMGFDPSSGYPLEATVEKLGLADVVGRLLSGK